MGKMYAMENLDSQTRAEGEALQLKLGVRWNDRDWGIFRTSQVEARESAARKEKLQSETKPVQMTSRADTKWARKLGNVQDSQAIRTEQRIHQVSKENQKFEAEKAKWDRQSESVLGDLKRQGYLG